MAYRVPFVNYPKQYHLLQQEIDGAIKEVLEGGDYIMRRHHYQFEKDMAAFVGTGDAVGLANCSDALFLALKALGIGPGDEVITVSHTFLATIAAIVNCGATPVLVDVGADYNMNAELIVPAITPRARAIMPVHLNGRLCDMDRIMTVARDYNLIVIEDAAQALGATFDGKKAGAFGLAGCFSFYPAKILGTMGDGGLLTTSDAQFAFKMRGLRDNGRVTGQDALVGWGFNSRLDNLHAAILDVKLRHIPAWLERRRAIAARYQAGLGGLDWLTTPPPPDAGRYYDVFQNYVIRTKKRDMLVAHLRQNGVEILISWPVPNHKQPALGLSHWSLPQTEAISREVLSLPMYPELEDAQIDYVVEVIKGFDKTHREGHVAPSTVAAG